MLSPSYAQNPPLSRSGHCEIGLACVHAPHHTPHTCLRALQALASFIIIQAALKRSHKLKKFSAR